MTTSKSSSVTENGIKSNKFAVPIGLTLIVVIGGILIFSSLGSASFWDDESFVAFVARTFVKTGNLSVWDGRNLYTYDDTACTPSKFNACNPPLDELMAAGSFKLFGISNVAARLPFAVAAVAALLALIFLLRLATPNARGYHLYSAAVLALSPCYLLYARNCRYYGLAMLLGTAIYLLYRKYLVSRSKLDLAVLVGLSALAFYANYLACGLILLSVGVVHLIFHRSEIKGNAWTEPVASIAAFLALTLPWFIATKAWRFGGKSIPEPWLPQHMHLLWWNLRDVNLHGILPWMVTVALAIFLFRSWKNRNSISEAETQVLQQCLEFAVLLGSTVILLGFLSPQPTIGQSFADIRYQAVAIPWMAGLTGGLLWYIDRQMRMLAILVLIVIIGTNSLTLLPPEFAHEFPYTSQFRLLLPEYVKGLTTPYTTANEEASAYLLQHAADDDTVVAVPQYEDAPLMYYAGSKIRICAELDEHATLPAEQVAKLNPSLLISQSDPKWIVLFGSGDLALHTISYFQRQHWIDGRLVDHQYYVAAKLNVYHVQTQRPELPLHGFVPNEDYNPITDAVYILEAGANASSSPSGAGK